MISNEVKRKLLNTECRFDFARMAHFENIRTEEWKSDKELHDHYEAAEGMRLPKEYEDKEWLFEIHEELKERLLNTNEYWEFWKIMIIEKVALHVNELDDELIAHYEKITANLPTYDEELQNECFPRK